MPFITEEIWQQLPHEGISIMSQPMPHLQEMVIDKKVERAIDTVIEIVTAIRNIRQELGIATRKNLSAIISASNKAKNTLLHSVSTYIQNLSRLSVLKIETEYTHIASSATVIIKDTHITIPLEGVIDIQKERSKIEERITKIESEIASKKATLENKEFIRKAPQEIVERERARLEELKETLKRTKTLKDGLL